MGGATGFGSQNLMFGNPWGKPNFNGDLSAFEISVGRRTTRPSRQTTVLGTLET